MGDRRGPARAQALVQRRNRRHHARRIRRALANGGSLEGRVIEIHVDSKMCEYGCPEMLPLLGRQFGNPTVTFVDKFGNRRLLRGGSLGVGK
jgi:hypothetical protein